VSIDSNKNASTSDQRLDYVRAGTQSISNSPKKNYCKILHLKGLKVGRSTLRVRRVLQSGTQCVIEHSLCSKFTDPGRQCIFRLVQLASPPTDRPRYRCTIFWPATSFLLLHPSSWSSLNLDRWHGLTNTLLVRLIMHPSDHEINLDQYKLNIYLLGFVP